jgi:cytoskeletal protein CcmA (bactofilin family)
MFNKAENNNHSTAESNTIVGQGTTFDGNIESADNLRIEGTLKGTVKTKAKIVLGASAVIEGDIFARNAEIQGTVKGKIEVSDLLILGDGCKVHGDIVTNKLEVRDGASFNGDCSMGVKSKEIKLGTDVPVTTGLRAAAN